MLFSESVRRGQAFKDHAAPIPPLQQMTIETTHHGVRHTAVRKTITFRPPVARPAKVAKIRSRHIGLQHRVVASRRLCGIELLCCIHVAPWFPSRCLDYTVTQHLCNTLRVKKMKKTVTEKVKKSDNATPSGRAPGRPGHRLGLQLLHLVNLASETTPRKPAL